MSRNGTLRNSLDEEVKYIKNESIYQTRPQRTSLERVFNNGGVQHSKSIIRTNPYDNKYHQSPSPTTPTAPRMALQPIILRPSMEMTTIDISDNNNSIPPSPYKARLTSVHRNLV